LASVIFELPARFSDEPPVRKAFLSTIQADLPGTTLFYNASSLDVIVPGVLRVAVDKVSVFGFEDQQRRIRYLAGHVFWAAAWTGPAKGADVQGCHG
jgi:alkylation response protein AidB-like acyl-CoA dehydrogenase